MDELVFLWEEYVKEKDSKLTKGAIKLKQQVREFVNSLPTLPRELRNEQVKKMEIKVKSYKRRKKHGSRKVVTVKEYTRNQKRKIKIYIDLVDNADKEH